MELLDSLTKIANELDQLGYFEDADEVDLMIEAVAEADFIKSANLVLQVKEDGTNNQYVVNSPDGALTVSSPIYQNQELAAAKNKAPGIQAMRAALAKELAIYRRTHPGVQISIQPAIFGVQAPAARPAAPAFTMGPATVTTAK